MNKISYVKKNYEFQKIINEKKQILNNNFILFYKKNNFNYSRFGLSVGKKNGNAVLRNKTKRQLRHMLQFFFIENNSFFSNSFDLIILVRKKYFENDFQTNKNILFKLLMIFQKKINNSKIKGE